MASQVKKWLIISVTIIIVYALSYVMSLPILSYLETYKVISVSGNSVTFISMDGRNAKSTRTVSPNSGIRCGNTINGWMLIFDDEVSSVNVASYVDDNDPNMTPPTS